MLEARSVTIFVLMKTTAAASTGIVDLVNSTAIQQHPMKEIARKKLEHVEVSFSTIPLSSLKRNLADQVINNRRWRNR